jgi:hypothetical protein
MKEVFDIALFNESNKMVDRFEITANDSFQAYRAAKLIADTIDHTYLYIGPVNAEWRVKLRRTAPLLKRAKNCLTNFSNSFTLSLVDEPLGSN